MSVRQYDRKVSILVGNESSAIELSALRVQFKIRRSDFQEPNSADVRILNVAETTSNRLTREFTRLVIQGGYEGNFGLLFDGAIKQARVGRVNALDSYVDITAADGDAAYNYSYTALTLAAGAQPQNAVEAFVQSMAQQGVGLGYMPELSQNGSPRGRVYYGLTRDELREWAEVQDCLWSIQDGKLTLIPKTSYIPGESPLISPATGLVGVPEQTQNGISMRVLLNPAIKIGQCVKLDATVNPLRYSLDVQSQANNALLESSTRPNPDGLYYVMSADHVGDTRGNEFYTDLTCLSVDATIPPSAAPRAAIAPEAASIRRY